MSTQNTIYSDNLISVNEDVFTHRIEITIRDVEFSLSVVDNEIRLDLPCNVWAALRQYGSHMERYLQLTEEELREEAETAVKDRLLNYDPKIEFLAYAGIISMGDINLPFEKQVENYMSYYKAFKKSELG